MWEETMEVWHVFLMGASFLFYLTVGSVFRLLQKGWWLLCGIPVKGGSCDYECSARIMNIMVRYLPGGMSIPASSSIFLCTHATLEHPRTVLRDNVTFYTLEKNSALFVETDSHVDVRSSEVDAFFRHAQYKYARRLIIMPIKSFHRLAEEVGSPKEKVLLVTNTTRCGSTLFCQLFENTGRCNVLCEPELFATGYDEVKDIMSREEFRRRLKHVVWILMKPPIGKPRPLLHVLKFSAPCINILPDLAHGFPGATQLFMYRDGLPTAQSVWRTSRVDALWRIIFPLATKSPWFATFILEKMTGIPGDDYKFTLTSELTVALLVWCHECNGYLKYKNEGVMVAAVKYEDIMTDKEGCVKLLFQYLNLPDDLVPLGMQAFSHDSQRKSHLSQKNINHYPLPEYTTAVETEMDGLCSKFGLPSVKESCRLDGTITDPICYKK